MIIKIDDLGHKIQQIEEYLILEKEHEALMNQQAVAGTGENHSKFEDLKEDVPVQNSYIENQVLDNEDIEEVALNNSIRNPNQNHKIQVNKIHTILLKEIESIAKEHLKDNSQDNRNDEINRLLDSENNWSFLKDGEGKDVQDENNDIL